MITGKYNLLADPSWSLLQLNEVRLECDTTAGPVTINLPAISTLAQSTNLKLVIVDATANASSNNIIINADASDTFDDSTTNQVILDTDGSSVVFQNLTSTQWLAVESVAAGGGGLPTLKMGSIVNIIDGTTIASQLPREFSLGNYYINPPISITGTISETIVSSVLIPGGTFRQGDIISGGLFTFLFFLSQSIPTATTISTYINNIDSLTGATLVSQTSGGGTGDANYTLEVQPSIGEKNGVYISDTVFQAAELGNPIVYNNINVFDISLDRYFILTVQLGDVSSLLQLYAQYSTNKVTQIVI